MSTATQDARFLQVAPTTRRPFDALGTALSTAALAVAGVGMVWLLVLAFGWYNAPFPGFLTDHALNVVQTSSFVGEDWAGLNAGVKIDDRVTGVEVAGNWQSFMDTDAEAGLRFNAILSHARRGDILTLDIMRPPGARTAQRGCDTYTSEGVTCRFRIVLGQIPGGDFALRFGIPMLVGVLFYAFALFILIRHWGNTTPRVSASLLGILACVIAGQFDLQSSHNAMLFWALAVCVCGGTMFQLTMLFPDELAMVRRSPVVRFVPIVAAFALYITYYSLYAQRGASNYQVLTLLSFGLLVAGGVTLFVAILVRRTRAPSPISRERAGVVLVAMTVAFAPLILWFAVELIDRLLTLPMLTFPVIYAMPTLLILPLGFVYALSDRSLIDMDRVVNEAFLYGILGAALILGYTLLTLALYFVSWGVLRWDNPILIAVTIFIIAVAFAPVRIRLERLLNDTFFRQRRRYESNIAAFARRLTSVVEGKDAAREFQTELESSLNPQYAFVFLRNPLTGEYEAVADTQQPRTDVRFSLGSPLLTWFANAPMLYLTPNQPLPPELAIERSRLSVLGTPVLARLQSANRLNGFLAVGPRRDRAPYSFEDLRYIEGLCGQAALAFERAQVILEAQRNEQELRVLSSVSAALNITMDFNTLLEFIYTQTDKVIRAPYFYIALVEPNTRELSFAFYQENGERDAAKEGTRWPLGKDLFSEVVRMQQPIKVESFTAENTRRGGVVPLETPLRAWVGVPLNAGTGSALGVVAIGTTDAGVTYSDDQVSIFASIADLAATALDKARLFRETETRARQLTVLNNISGQLASEFENVESLLGMITQSAVEMLRAEAGSLLLIEESANDLVFEVVIGGAGQRLLGTHIPPGVGIVGKVVETGRHIIVNDAQDSPEWYGNIAGNAARQSAFRTEALLAVPLSARGRVIGVLEVINKRDRTDFVEEDVSLLTAFASQAAVGIENARLFRMTDQQLELRVNQLDNMARIDQELNRTLDLRAAIDLTLDNALRESGADAGVLALIPDGVPAFEIAGSIGYPAGVYARGERYSLEYGVLGRVYRAASPTLITELDHDPNAFETLPGAVGQLAVPMITAGKGVTAVLLLETRSPGIFNMMNLSFISALAEHANTAITNSQLFSQLQQANAARTQFVGFVAHELKNPMTSIKGYSETLLSGMMGGLTDMQKSFVNTISRNVTRMQQIVEDLRDLTALEAGALSVKTRPVSFNNIVLETLRPQQRAIDEKQQHLIVDVPEELPQVQGDEGRLVQVLTNFVSNAYKYTPEGGTITLFAEVAANRWDADGAPEVIHCTVTDTGLGMSDDDVKRLSTPYFRSTNPEAQAQPGTGLGMTITYALIEAHGGKVWVESKLDVGSTFHFTVPLALSAETTRN